ncbi:MAG: carboxypeptidase regulatory-like domain-containing protein [bacterium]|nr:carboxypeptidase regulatory-like domain-containing protein [bacterium]
MVLLAMLVPSISYGYGTITGRVANPLSQQSLSGAIVAVLYNNIVIQTTTTDINGNYSFSNLAPELYSIRASTPDYATRFFPSPIRVAQASIIQNIDIPLVLIGNTSGKVTFDANLNENREIYSINANASNSSAIARLTYNLYDDYDPCVSWDNAKITFVSNRDNNNEIYIMNSDGSNQLRLTNISGQDTSPSFSPDASQIVFSSNRDGNYEIYRMNSNGSNPTRLTNHPSSDMSPAFSPDGRKIVFSSTRGSTNNSSYDLYIMNAQDGSGVTRLITATGTTGAKTGFAFSPDGQKIAFSLQSGTNTDIYIIDIDGSSGLKRLTNHIAEDSSPSFSPDGRQVIFCSTQSGRMELFAIDINAATGDVRKLIIDTPLNPQSNPSWSTGCVATGSISGKIEDAVFQSQPVANALIEMMHNKTIIATASTTSNGQYTISNLTMGLFKFRVSCPGFKTFYLQQPAAIHSGSITTSDALLHPLCSNLGKIAFVSARDGNQEIYICNGNGSRLTRLTYNQYSDIDPCLSPDGKKIVFTSRRSGNEDIFIMNSDGSEPKMLTNSPGNDCYPSFSPDGKKILFTSYRYGNADLFLMDIDTLEVTRLTSNPYDEYEATFSPDGEQIAYTTFVNNTNKLYQMDSCGRNQRRLTSSAGEEHHPSFSPNMEKIAFSSNVSGDYEIYTINTDGSNQQRLTISTGRDGNPCFSPDGYSLSFCSEQKDGYEICTMNNDGSNVQRLTTNIDTDFYPSWSVGYVPVGAICGTITNSNDGSTPVAGAMVEVIQGITVIGSSTTNANGTYTISDLPAGLFIVRVSCLGYIPASFQGQVTVIQGFMTPDINISLKSMTISQTKIAFTSYVTNDNAEIYIVNHDGTHPTRLTYSIGYDGDASPSPDGKRFVFCSKRDGNSEIYIMEADGSTQLRLTNNPASDLEPKFSFDGQRVIFTSNRDGHDEVYMMNIKGNELQRLTYASGNSNNPSFSPDGTRVLFASNRSSGNYEIYIMNLDGSNLRRLTTNSSEDRDPTFSPDGTRIVFWSNRDGNREIYSMNIDGSNQQRLTYNTGCDDDPFFSPDGRKIAFCSTYRDNKIEVYTMDIDGTHQERITHLLDNIYSPIWGVENVGTGSISGKVSDFLNDPVHNALIEILSDEMKVIGSITTKEDGSYMIGNIPIGYFMLRASSAGYETRFYPDRLNITTGIKITPIDIPLFPIGQTNGKVVFTSEKDGNAEIYIMNADGSNQSRLTNNPANDMSPAFSTGNITQGNGTRIAFASNRDGNYEIYIMNADGTEQKRLTDNQAKDSCPAFSPDGRLIAFHSDRNKTFEIYTMNIDGLNQINLGPGITPCFSPDGSRIVFSKYYNKNYDIFIMNRDGSNQRRLTTHAAYDYDPVFSPDGEKIAFTSHRDGNAEIYIMNIDGSNQMRLTNSPDYDGEAEFSPDGKQIAFVSRRLGNNDELWIMDINGNNALRLTTNSSNDYQPAWAVASVGIISSVISGIVTSHQGTVIPNAIVELLIAGTGAAPMSVVKTALTNTKGMYSIIVPGTETYKLRCSAEGGYVVKYLDLSLRLLPGTKLTNVNIILLPIGAKGGKIAFVSDWKGTPDIYVCNADGSNITRLTNDLAIEAGPTLSYDGSKVVFYADIGGKKDTNELYMMNADGCSTSGSSSLKRLTTNTLNDVEPHLSPDGKTIVYASGYNHNKEIYLLDIASSIQKRLTYNFYDDSSPKFSPDGSKIVFCSCRDGLSQVYMMNADGSDQVNLTGNSSANYYPHFSMDGEKIFFQQGTGLYEMNLRDRSIRFLTAASGISSASPDNKQTILSYNNNICILNNGSSRTIISNSSYNHSPYWSSGEVRCGAISGIITDIHTNDPIIGAVVKICQGTATVAAAVTGLNGRYTINNLMAERYSLKVSCPGYAIRYLASDVFVAQDTTVEISLSLQPLGQKGGKIAFVSDRDGNKEIYVMNADGTNQTRLTDNLVDDYDPCLSIDGTRVVFCSMRDNNEEIYIMDVSVSSGNSAIRLTSSPGSDRQPRFSPDGTKIIFTANRDGDDDIYIMDVAGKNQRKLTNSMAAEYSPCFSPDGKMIAFCSDYPTGEPQIYFMDINSQEMIQTTNIPGGCFNPCFSPDGLQLIFSTTEAMFVMNIGETAAMRLYNGSVTNAYYSPDGERIVFCLNSQVCAINIDGSQAMSLTIDSWHNDSPVWSTGEVKTGSICGNITDAFEKKPIAGARINIIQGLRLIAASITDTSGNYCIDGLAAGKYLVYASELNYGMRYWQGYVRVTASSTTKDIDIQLIPVKEGGKIAFVSEVAETQDVASHKEIYIMNINGSNLTNLSQCPANDFDPCLSADGKKIAFTSDRNGNTDIYIIDVEGTKSIKRLTTDPKHDYEPTISSDGKKIAFTTDWDGDDEIYIINADGTGEKRLTNNLYKDSSPCISPDGTRIAFCSILNGKSQVCLMNIDGTNTINLTGTTSNNYNPSFSPDGLSIVFWSNRDDAEKIYTMNIDGSNVRPLADGADNPCFSPDGEKIAFSSSGQIYMMDVNGANKFPLLSNPKLKNNHHPSWSTDSVKTGSFSGIISCSLNSTPIRGATVEVFQGTDTIISAITDGNGKFLLQHLVAEPYFIRAYAPDYNTQCLIGTRSIIASTDTANINISLTPVVRGGLVAFMSDDGIYLMNADGTGKTRLLSNPVYTGTGTPPCYSSPCLSPDGRKIAFSSDINGNSDIYLMDTNGLNLVQLTNAATKDTKGTSPCFSQDGKLIAFVSGNDICLKDILTGSITTIIKGTNTTRGTGTTTTTTWNRSPRFSPDGTRLIYCANSNGLPQVYSTYISGTVTCNLTGSSSSNLSPSFSPDGRKIVFSSNRDGERHRLYLMDPDGSNQQYLPVNLDSELREPCFSPDGKRIIFWANNPDLYILELNSGNLTQLTSGTASDTKPSWSAGAVGMGRIIGTVINQNDDFPVPGAAVNIYQGKQLISTAITDVFGQYSIPDVYIGEYLLTISYPGRYALKRIPTPVRVISDMNTIVNTSLIPLGEKNSKIVFAAQRDGSSDTNIYIMNADGSNQQQLTSEKKKDEGIACSYQPCFSPDGQKIAFVSNIEGNNDIYLMNSDASNKIRLTTSDAEDNNPSFSPDSKKIIYASIGSGIKIIDIETMQQQDITIGAGTYLSPSFSPDGQRIVFTNRLNEQDENIFVMDVNGSNTLNLTGSSSRNHSPIFSPDGLKIAFVSCRDGNENIYIMDADGAHQGRLTSNSAENLCPSFSPDGQKIVFYSNRDGNNEICSIDLEGRAEQRLTDNLSNDFHPYWGCGDIGTLTGSITGMVSRFLNDIPIYRARVSVYQGQTLIATATTNINGTYSVQGIPVGTYTVIALHPEYISRVYKGEVKVIAEATTPAIDFSLPYFERQGRFAFTSERDGNHEIYTMNGDNSNHQRLTFNLIDDMQPSMSMDSTKIAFVSDRDGNKEIYIMNAEGYGQRRLTISEGEDSHPCVSADGDRIAFCSERDGNFEIYIMNIDGTNQTRLTKDSMNYEDRDPFISLDSKKITFVSDRDGNKEIYIMNTDGSQQKRLTNNLFPDYDPCISPDGKRIVYTSVIDNNEEIFIMNIDGSGQKRLTNNPAHDYDPQFSPDGTRIAFATDMDGFKRIYIMDINGEGLIPIINLEPNNHLSPLMNQDSYNPCWVSGGYGQASIAGKVISAKDISETVFGARIEAIQGTLVMGVASTGPTGKYTIFGLLPGIYRLRVSAPGYAVQFLQKAIIVRQYQLTADIDFKIIPIGSRGGKITFVSDRNGSQDIYVCNADGTNQTRLTYGNYNNYTPEFSPDGRKIVFVSDRTGNNEIYIMEADGTDQKRLTYSSRNNQSPCFSPYVAGQIIFSSNGEFMVMNIDGTQQRRLETNLTGESPCFAPDGTRIVFTKNNQIYMSSNDGSNLAHLTNGLLQEAEPVFSPDGETISFTGIDTELQREGFLYNIEKKTITILTKSFRSDAISSYSPDGKRIAFTTNRDGSGKGEIYSMALDGSLQMRLTNNNANDYQPSWAPGDVGPGTISGVIKCAFVSRRNAENAENVKKAPTMEAVSAASDTNAVIDEKTLSVSASAFVTDAVMREKMALASTSASVTDAVMDEKKPSVSASATDAVMREKTALASTHVSGTVDSIPKEGVENTANAFSLASNNTLIKGARIEILQNGLVIASTLTDVDGRYTIPGLAGGNYLLRCSAPPEYGVKSLTSEATIAIEDKTLILDLELFPIGTRAGRIVFVKDDGNNQEIYSSYPDGSSLLRLTNNPANDHSPAISPDGSMIAFVSCRDGNNEIYLMNIDGSCRMRMTNTGINEYTPAFSSFSSSPDGKQLIFCSETGIFVMNIDSKSILSLTDGINSLSHPSFSPDGQKIVFASNGNIYTMASDSRLQPPTMLTSLSDLSGLSVVNIDPCFSPDGTKIAFASDRDGNFDIYLMNSDGTNQTMVTNDSNKNTKPAFSPDGTKLIFCSFCPQIDGNNRLFTIDTDGKNQQVIGTDSASSFFSPCWGVEYCGSAVIYGSLSVNTMPDGARVYIDGMNTNKLTPAVLSAPPGTHTITLTRDWYEVWKGTISISQEQAVSMNAILCGSISIFSIPDGAAVYIDGTLTGKTTPCMLTNVPYGTHTISLSKDGYQTWSRAITLSTNTTTAVNASMLIYGSVSINSSPAGAMVCLDGTSTGKTTPCILSNVPAGTHTIALTLNTYQTWTGTITISTTTTFVPLDITLFTHKSVSINSEPAGADVYLDGTATNKVTPCVLTDVQIGVHAITLINNSNSQEWMGTITVSTNTTSTLLVIFGTSTGTNSRSSISLTSFPTGAAISLDGVNIDNLTPCVLSNIPLGSHTIGLSKDGYQTRACDVTISPSMVLFLSVGLDTAQMVYGSISITSTPTSGATVYLDGTSTSKTTPCCLSMIPIGTHTISLSKDGYQAWTMTAMVSTNTTMALEAVLVPIATSTNALVKMQSILTDKNISADISITNAKDLCGVNLVLRYDITKINMGSITKGDALSGLSCLFFPEVNTMTGIATISMAVLSAVIPDGNVVRINAHVITEEEITPEMVMEFITVELRDVNNVPIPYSIIITGTTTSGTSTSEAGLWLSPKIIPISVGSVFPVDIVAKNVTDLTIAELHLLFDPQRLQVMDSDSIADGIQINGSTFFGDIIKNTADNSKGLIQFTSHLLVGTATANGTIATIFFKSTGNGTSTIGFSLNTANNQETKLINNHAAIPFTMATATVTATGGWNGNISGFVGILDEGNLSFTDQITVTLSDIATVTTNMSGYFFFSGIAPGTYTLTADIPGSSYATKTVILLENEQINIGTISLLAGDANNDRAVNSYDLLVLRNAFGSMKGASNWNPMADFRPDGYINAYDLLTLRHNFGKIQMSAPMMLSKEQPTPLPSSGHVSMSASLCIEPQYINPTINSIFTVNVRVADVKDMAAAELHLVFNPDILEVVDADLDTSGIQISPGNFPAGAGIIKNQTDNQTGRINFTSYLLSNVVSGTGVLASISFRAKAVGTCGVSFDFNTLENRETKVLNSSGAINITANEANLAVSLTTPTDRFINVKAYPNPLIVGTTPLDEITLDGLPNTGMVDVKIYNIAGEMVLDKTVPAVGNWKWNAKNNDNELVASGIYIYLMTNEKDRAVGKIAVIR